MSDNAPIYLGLELDEVNNKLLLDLPLDSTSNITADDGYFSTLTTTGDFYRKYNDTAYNMISINSSGNTNFSYGPWNNSLGTTQYLGNNIVISSKGTISIDSSTGGNITFGTSGHDHLYFGGRGMIRKGESYTFQWSGCGFCSNAKQDAYFTIPFLPVAPAFSSVTINKTSSTICIRQWNNYIYNDGNKGELSMSNFASVTGSVTNCGLYIMARRTGGLGGNGTSTTTNMTNNAPICITCHIVATFS